MDVTSLEKHPVLTTSTDVAEICGPLKKLGITYFSFVRSFEDGGHIRLSNNPEWTRHYYSREFYNVVTKQVPDKNDNILWSSIDPYPLFSDASEHFNIDNGTVVVLNNSDVTERYFFGSTKQNTDVNDIYVHQPDLLKKFIMYFKQTANQLITRAEDEKIIVPSNMDNQNKSSLHSNCDNLVREFLDDIEVKKISIRVSGEDIYITKNEAKLLALMKRGYTAKEIANEIGLKVKTIEAYRDRLKDTLKQYSKSNLIALAQANSLLDIDLLN